MSTITHERLLVEVCTIADPAAREQVRRRVNRLNVLPFKLTATICKTDSNHTGTCDWTGERLESVAPLLKSGPRKGWPKGSLPAEVIAGLETMQRIDSFEHARTPGKKQRSRNRRRTTVQDITGLHAADKALAEGKVQWAEDGALIPA